MCFLLIFFFFFKQKTAYEMRISDWSSDVCSSDLRYIGQHPQLWKALLQGGDYAGHQALRVGRFDAVGCFKAGVDHREQSNDRNAQRHAFFGRLQQRVGRIADHAGHGRNGLLYALTKSEEHTSELQSLMRISYAVFFLKTKK